MACPCETRTSTWRSFATISSGLYRFLAITVLLDVKDIPQVGPLQWGRTSRRHRPLLPACGGLVDERRYDSTARHRCPGDGDLASRKARCAAASLRSRQPVHQRAVPAADG